MERPIYTKGEGQGYLGHLEKAVRVFLGIKVKTR